MRPIDYFDVAVEQHSDRLAIVDGDTRLSFAALQRMTTSIAEALAGCIQSATAAPIAIVSRNDYRVLACTLGIMRAGHIVVPVHAGGTSTDIGAQLMRTAPAVVFYHSSVLERVIDVRKNSTLDATWVCLDSVAGDDPSLETFLSRHPGIIDDWGDIRDSLDRPVYVRATSGSTGIPRLVIDDIRSFNVTQQALRGVLGPSRPEAFLAVAPLSHACGVFAFTMLTFGASVVIMRDFDIPRLIEEVTANGVTHVWLPPSALYLLLEDPAVRQADWSTLRRVILGAAGVSRHKLREAVELFGPCVCINYSQIEAGFLTWLDEHTIAAGLRDEHSERLSSSGTSLFVGRIAIMDDEGRLLSPCEVGEIVVRGPSVRNYHDAADTLDARRFGWHHTGDIGTVREGGYLYVLGRKKDVINTAGFKIAAAEVEEVIMQLPSVAECAVVGMPDDLRGEAVCAVVVLRPDETLETNRIAAHCRARLGTGKTPRQIRVWPTLPRTAVGKIDKQSIRLSFV